MTSRNIKSGTRRKYMTTERGISWVMHWRSRRRRRRRGEKYDEVVVVVVVVVVNCFYSERAQC